MCFFISIQFFGKKVRWLRAFQYLYGNIIAVATFTDSTFTYEEGLPCFQQQYFYITDSFANVLLILQVQPATLLSWRFAYSKGVFTPSWYVFSILQL